MFEFLEAEEQPVETTVGWLRDFLKRRQELVKPDGRALFEYRTTESELDELRQLLDGRIPKGTHDCAAFCLYCAEWWRRHGKGLTFDGLLKSLDLDVSYTRLYGAIERGLKYWRRSLRIGQAGDRRWRDFVGSLSREGGLPLQMLLGAQTSIRRFFRQLLRECVSGELTAARAELAAHELPQAWRHPDIYGLAAELVTHVWELRKSVSNSERPALELDRTQPGWQQRLPILMDSDVAIALVRGLVEDAQKIATSGRLGLAVETRLIERDGARSLQRVVEPPPKVQAREMWKLLGLDPNANDNPRRIRILVDDGSGAQALAVATQWETDKPFKLKPLVDRWFVSTSTAELVVLAETREASYAGRLLRGGEALDDGPWIFVADGEEDATTEWKLVAQGSARVRANHALVALPATCRPQSGGPSVCGQLATPSGDRNLFRIPHGRVHFTDTQSGERYYVEAAAAEDEARSYRCEGPLFGEDLRPPVWRGIPKIIEESLLGVRREVHPRELEWRPRGVGLAWSTLSSDCLGHVDLRLRRGGDTVFAKSIRIVPEATTIDIRPTTCADAAELSLCGIRALTAEPVRDPGFQVAPIPRTTEHAWTFTATDCPPSRVSVDLTWSMSRRVRIRLPFPNVGVRFVDRAGRVLPNGATVALGHLPGCQVEAIFTSREPAPVLEAKLKNAHDRTRGFAADSNFSCNLRDVTPRGAPAVRRYALNLSRCMDDVRLRLASSTELNAFIRLEVVTQAGSIKINVRRFPLAMMVDHEREEVVVLRDKSETFVDALIDRMELSRIPISQPAAEPVPMVRGEQGWAIGELEQGLDTWLVVARDDGRCCGRPVIWTPPVQLGPPPDNADQVFTIQQAVRLPWKDVRLRGIARVLDSMLKDAQHPEWVQLLPYLQSLGDLPASTYDIFDIMVRKPAMCVYALLATPPKVGFHTLWTAFEQLSFAWEFVGVSDWLAGFKLWWDRQCALTGTLDEDIQQTVAEAFQSHLRGTLEFIETRLRGFAIVRELIETDILGAAQGQYVQFVTFPGGVGRAPLLASRDDAQMDLFRTHADDRRWPLFQAIRELAEQFPDRRPDSLAPLEQFEHTVREKQLSATFAPIQAAIASACSLSLSVEQIFAIRQLQAFDITWFERCYETTLAAAIGIILENDQKAFR